MTLFTLQSAFRISVALVLFLNSAEAALAPLVPANGDGSISPMDAAAADVAYTDEAAPVSRSSSGVIPPKSPITVNFHEADIRDVFRLLALKSGMNIIYGADVAGTMTLHLDRVPFDQAFQTVLTLRNLVAIPMGDKVIRIVTSSTLTQEQSQAAIFTKVYRLNYAAASDVKAPLDSVRSASGRRGISNIDTKSNALVITDTPEGLTQAEDLIRELDRKPQQVDIEAKIVEVQLDNRLNTGISWSYAADVKGGNSWLGSSEAGTGNRGVSGPDVREPNGPGTGAGIALPASNNAGNLVGLSFLTQQGSYLLSAKLDLLARESKVKILSSPHIITLNNEEAKINVVEQIPYRTTTTSSGGNVTENVSFVDAGVKLSVKPTINSDRRITLKVKPDISNAVTDTEPPRIATRNAETTITLKDGETIAIGGLIREQDENVIEGVPYLMNIPILGYLFKRKGTRKTRTELIVFITPRIAGE